MKIDKTNVKTPLTKSELDLLIRKQMPNDRLDRIRDVFVFCRLTGLAFTDADLIDRGKIAILMGSLAAAIVGCLLILAFSKKSTRQ